ncbi:amino acid permease [Nocardia sp. SYP-A9097]|uniref:APC family permease n=1 Tax=Nocardia sp. SYP-A9097 TaxID=2663237 RepID=UPI00129ABFBF|nr:APC family permease [Nocardia sp. SYP-A9097]MRH91214.1 amino acid permease [Nocardia sp. SYP-A9097]
MTENDDAKYLATLGYKQHLDRTLGSFSAFATGFSVISILTGCFQLFFFAFGFAGPSFLLTWPVVLVGQFCLALCFAELAAQYPFAGSVYAWSKKLASQFFAWMAGYLTIVAQIVTVAGVSVTWQVLLPTISPWFQFVGDGTGQYDFSGNAVVLGSTLIVMCTVINLLGVKLVALVNNIGVIVELVCVVLLVGLLALHVQRGPQVVFETNGAGGGSVPGYVAALLASSLLAMNVLWAFDGVGSVSEETVDPRRKTPIAILRAVATAGIGGFVLMLLALMAVGDIKAQELSISGLPYVVTSVLGDFLGKLLLVGVTIAIGVCVLAIQTAAARQSFAMARDNRLPYSRWISHVSPRTKTPVVPTVFVAVCAIVILVINVSQPQLIVTLASFVVVLAYLAYLIVGVSLLVKRLAGQWKPQANSDGDKHFSLGRWGIPVNLIAIAMGVFGVVNLVWPRREVYNPAAPFHWYLQWGGVLALVLIVGGGAAWYYLVQRHKTGVIAEHAASAGNSAPLSEESAAAFE